MDDTQLKLSCSDNILYISLEEQNEITANLHKNFSAIPQKRPKDCPTFIHLSVQYRQHYAAIQLSSYPFSLENIPEQTFLKSSFRYVLCCQQALEARSFLDIVCRQVQTIYDVFYQPDAWNFSSKHCRIQDSTIQYSEEIGCAKATELALLAYITSATGSIYGRDTFVDQQGDLNLVDVVSNAIPTRSENRGGDRRRRRSQEDDLCASSGSNKRLRRDPHEIVSLGGGDCHRNDEDDETEDGDETEDCDEALSEANVDDKEHDEADSDSIAASILITKEQQAASSITKKIRRGLEKMNIRKGKPLYDPYKFEGDSGDLDQRISDFHIRFSHGEYKILDRLLCLELVLWKGSKLLTTGVKATAWKYSFLAACIRNVRTYSNQNCDDIRELEKKSYKVDRWTTAATIINSIVSGLFSKWEWKAFLIYEALAEMNFQISQASSYSAKSRKQIIEAVVYNLGKDNQPDITSDTLVLHPASFVSCATEIEYSDVCSKLGLGSAGLVSPQSKKSHISISSLAYGLEIHNSSTSSIDSSRVLQITAHPETRGLDTLTAAAEAQISSSTELTRIGSTVNQSPPIEDQLEPLLNQFAHRNPTSSVAARTGSPDNYTNSLQRGDAANIPQPPILNSQNVTIQTTQWNSLLPGPIPTGNWVQDPHEPSQILHPPNENSIFTLTPNPELFDGQPFDLGVYYDCYGNSYEQLFDLTTHYDPFRPGFS